MHYASLSPIVLVLKNRPENFRSPALVRRRVSGSCWEECRYWAPSSWEGASPLELVVFSAAFSLLSPPFYCGLERWLWSRCFSQLFPKNLLSHAAVEIAHSFNFCGFCRLSEFLCDVTTTPALSFDHTTLTHLYHSGEMIPHEAMVSCARRMKRLDFQEIPKLSRAVAASIDVPGRVYAHAIYLSHRSGNIVYKPFKKTGHL